VPLGVPATCMFSTVWSRQSVNWITGSPASAVVPNILVRRLPAPMRRGPSTVLTVSVADSL
jgi:hypothetical protein